MAADRVHPGASALLKKFDEYEKRNSWNTIFMALQAMSKTQQDELKLTCDIAYEPENHEKNRCYPYFPHGGTKLLEFRGFIVDLTAETVKDHYTLRELKITLAGSEESKSVFHFQYTTWPDFEVPDRIDEFVEFVEAVRDLDDSLADKKAIVCHCSAGVGRTGTFAVVDILLSAMRKKVEEELPQIDLLVLFMRQYRMYLIQTPSQLRFCWRTMAEYIKHKLEELENNRSEEPRECSGSAESVSQAAEENTTDEVEPRPKAATLPRKRHSHTDHSPDFRQKRDRAETIARMRQRQRDFERQKTNRDYWTELALSPSVLLCSAVVGAALVYRFWTV